MLRLEDIQKKLRGVVGWENGYGDTKLQVVDIQDYEKFDPMETESGLTFQAAHPLVTLENIRSIMPADYSLRYPEYKTGGESGFGYWYSERVRYKDAVYFCVNHTYDPPENSSDWVLWNPLQDFIEDIERRSINTVVQKFIQTKQLNRETQSLMERRTLFDGAARLQNIIDPRGRLVGLEIVPVRSLGVTTKIERIGLQMRGGTGEVRIYIFHSSQVEPIYSLLLDYESESGGFQWFNVRDIFLPYMGNPESEGETNSGGAWYVVYNQNELPDGMRALNMTKDWSAEPCQTCLGGSLESWRQITKYLQISPFSTRVPEDWTESDPVMFDTGKMNYTNTINYGINLEISVACDLSDFIMQQRDIFATAIQKQVAYDVLRTLAMNPDVRVNRNQVNITRDQLLYEVDGNPQGRASGIGYELAQAYKALDIDTKGLDRICLKCQNGGVKYRTV